MVAFDVVPVIQGPINFQDRQRIINKLKKDFLLAWKNIVHSRREDLPISLPNIFKVDVESQIVFVLFVEDVGEGTFIVFKFFIQINYLLIYFKLIFNWQILPVVIFYIDNRIC